jgi:lysyl-tRNA synthetase class 2
LQFEPRDQFEQRLKKLEQIQALGHAAYPHEFRWTHTATNVLAGYGSATAEELEAKKVQVRVAGRIVSLRLMGKLGFAHLQNGGKRLQVLVRKDVVGEAGFALFHLLDLGDSMAWPGICFGRRPGNSLCGSKRLPF